MTALTTKGYLRAFEQEVGPVDPAYNVKPLLRLCTGLRSLDLLLNGGVPVGHLTEIIGVDDCGKSTLLLHLLAEHGGVLIDCDGHYDNAYARRIGASPLLANVVELAAVSMVVTEFLRAGELVIIDSLAAVVSQSEQLRYELEFLVGGWFRTASDNGGTLIAVDQLRYRPGVGYRMRATGGPFVTTYAAMRLQLHPIKGDIEVDVIRDVHNPSLRGVALDLEAQYGFSREGAWLDAAVALGEVMKSGSWYVWPTGEVIAQGRDEAKKALAHVGR